jgi:hypothetical protein
MAGDGTAVALCFSDSKALYRFRTSTVQRLETAMHLRNLNYF